MIDDEEMTNFRAAMADMLKTCEENPNAVWTGKTLAPILKRIGIVMEFVALHEQRLDRLESRLGDIGSSN